MPPRRKRPRSASNRRRSGASHPSRLSGSTTASPAPRPRSAGYVSWRIPLIVSFLALYAYSQSGPVTHKVRWLVLRCLAPTVFLPSPDSFRHFANRHLPRLRAIPRPHLRASESLERLKFAEFILHHVIPGIWCRIAFSDEKVFVLDPTRRALSVYGFDENDPRRFITHHGQSTIKIHVWGIMTMDGYSMIRELPMRKGSSELGVNTLCYAALLYRVVAWLWSVPNKYIFQQDNCRLHVTSEVYGMCAMMPGFLPVWPPRSPDLSPIEFAWAKCESIIAAEVETGTIRTRDDFSSAIRRAFRIATARHSARECYTRAFFNVLATHRTGGSNKFSSITWKQQYAAI